MKATTKDWLDFAMSDLMNCEKVKDESFLTNIVAYHSQQAVEKSFKAILEEKGLIIPRVHSLQRLYDNVKQFLDTEVELSELALLDSVYTSSRYPGEIGVLDSGKPTIKEATQLYEIAKKLYEMVLQKLMYSPPEK